MRADVGAILGLPKIYKPLEDLDECEILTIKGEAWSNQGYCSGLVNTLTIF